MHAQNLFSCATMTSEVSIPLKAATVIQALAGPGQHPGLNLRTTGVSGEYNYYSDVE